MSMTQTPIRLTVNGRIHDVDAAADTALLYVLRTDLELNGPKYGCGLGEAAYYFIGHGVGLAFVGIVGFAYGELCLNAGGCLFAC